MDIVTNAHAKRINGRYHALKGRMFSRSSTQIGILTFSKHGTKNEHQIATVAGNCLRYLDDVETYTLGANLKYEHFLIIPQEYSWGRLCVTEAAFEKLLNGYGVFVDFRETVTAFGLKTSDDERMVYGGRACARQRGCRKKKHELCYNVLYMERHGRNLDDPWSLRQTGVYYQQSVELHPSRWILVNPSTDTKMHLEAFMQEGLLCCSLSAHVEILSWLTANWSDYIEYTTLELSRHDNKACYSSVESEKATGYTVFYADMQYLHILRKKLQRAEAAVDSNIHIIKTCQSFFSSHSGNRGHHACCKDCHITMRVISNDLDRHRSSLLRLSHRLRDIMDIISSILMFRNEELMQASNRASGKALHALLNITDQEKQQQHILTRILLAGQADSALLKTLSIVATVCLPASLVATIFSSNLIQSAKSDVKEPASRLVLSSQFWVYAAISLPLMAVTLTWVLYQDRKSRQSAKLSCSESKP